MTTPPPDAAPTTAVERACDACGTPESEVTLESGGWGMFCASQRCAEPHGPWQRKYAELTPALLDRLECVADNADRYDACPGDILHALVRAARAQLQDNAASERTTRAGFGWPRRS